MQLHMVLRRGLPNKAAVHLVDGLVLLDHEEVVTLAIGLSPRTYLRYKSDKKGHLDAEHSSRAWKFAEVLTKATSVFGSKEEAERWLARPATGLDRQRPIDLLETQTGTELVEEFLERIDYGAYS
jgi:putative toxin-antitoxin system antitoxin component (TIGR02293 family)